MGTCVVFQWARAVLSQQFLSLIPSDIDRADLLSEVTTELHLTADLTTDVSCPALQGHWEDILHAQIKLIELLTKWQEEKSAKKLNSPSVLNTNDENSIHNNCKLEDAILNDNVPVQSVDVSSDDFLLSNSSTHKQANFQNSSEQVLKQRCSMNETKQGVKSSQDIHSVYVFSNDCTRLDLIPSIECTVPSVTQSSLSTQNNTEKFSVAVDPSTSSQLILVTASSVIDQKIKNEAVEGEQKEELYMNIVLATRKDSSTSSKQIDNKNDDIVQVQTRSRENPLDKLCQLLKIDEEDTVPDTTDKKCDESERRRRYEENMPYKYFCSSCSFKTKRENQFLKHSKLHEKHRMIYHCHHCPFSTIRISTLRRHQLQHNEGRLMNCPKCPYKTDSSKFLTKHIQKKHSMDKPTLRCCQCDFAAGSLRELKKHRHLHNPAKPKMFWNCSLCSYKTQNKGHLQRHTNDVHELIRPYLCHHCGKSFKRHDTLKQHKMIHGEVGPVYTCSQCNKVCRSSTQLKEHLTVHTTQRPFLCELCGATFKTRSNQCKHIKMMHSAVKLFPCSFCKRTFSSKSTMMRHQKIHKEKEYSTDVDPNTSKACIVNKMCSTSTSSELINENLNRGNHE